MPISSWEDKARRAAEHLCNEMLEGYNGRDLDLVALAYLKGMSEGARGRARWLAIHKAAEAVKNRMEPVGGRLRNLLELPKRGPTRPELLALQRLKFYGAEGWAQGFSRAGGAIGRMFDRMRRKGWVVGPPYELTDAGQAVLTHHEGRLQ